VQGKVVQTCVPPRSSVCHSNASAVQSLVTDGSAPHRSPTKIGPNSAKNSRRLQLTCYLDAIALQAANALQAAIALEAANVRHATVAALKTMPEAQARQARVCKQLLSHRLPAAKTLLNAKSSAPRKLKA
jgi:hypothetical protein